MQNWSFVAGSSHSDNWIEMTWLLDLNSFRMLYEFSRHIIRATSSDIPWNRTGREVLRSVHFTPSWSFRYQSDLQTHSCWWTGTACCSDVIKRLLDYRLFASNVEPVLVLPGSIWKRTGTPCSETVCSSKGHPHFAGYAYLVKAKTSRITSWSLMVNLHQVTIELFKFRSLSSHSFVQIQAATTSHFGTPCYMFHRPGSFPAQSNWSPTFRCRSSPMLG